MLNQAENNNSLETICVDLDDTLLLSDSLLESILILLKRNPLNIFLVLMWMMKGISFFKNAVATHTQLDPEHLNYNSDVIKRIKEYKQQGYPIYLVTGASELIANSIADHLKLFDGVLASTKLTNLTGTNKARACIENFGENRFIYLGDCKKDLKVWKFSKKIICVSNSQSLIKRFRVLNKDIEIIARAKPKLKDYLKAIRVHQYAKNVLLLLPIFLNKDFFALPLWQAAALAFIAFCLTCSAVYIINDLYDLKADRQHKIKYRRGFASGLIPIKHGLFLFTAFIILSIGVQLVLHNSLFSIAIGLYFILSIAYTQWLKQIAILDVMVLTVLYTIRIVAGMLLLNEPLSHWFLSFSIFFFLSLSYLKRYIELSAMHPSENKIPGRGYQQQHHLFVKINGLATGCLSVVIFLLYIASTKAQHIYADSSLLYIAAFAIFYWLQRIWLLSADGKVHSDPVLFAVKDKVSYAVAFICIIAIIFAHVGI